MLIRLDVYEKKRGGIGRDLILNEFEQRLLHGGQHRHEHYADTNGQSHGIGKISRPVEVIHGMTQQQSLGKLSMAKASIEKAGPC